MIPIKDDNPRSGLPILTLVIIAVNIVIHVHKFSLTPRAENAFNLAWGAVPAQILNGMYLETLFTSMYLHGDLLHLGSNMLFLWIFGDNIEDLMGKGRYLIFYTICGFGASIAHIIVSPTSTVPMIGASGAISGVLGAYAITYPRARVLVLIPIFIIFTTVRVPAVIVLGLWFVMQLGSGLVSLGQESGGGIAWFAHIGGFVLGILMIRTFARPAALPGAAYIEDEDDYRY